MIDTQIKTPDGRYLVIDSVLWRTTRPDLPEVERQQLVNELMSARRAIRDAKGDDVLTRQARRRVQEAKVGLGERGPVWWEDGASDYNRRRVSGTPYADWYQEAIRSAPTNSS